MAKIPIVAILWRRVNQATFDTLRGESRGQYDIRLTKLPELEDFFQGIEQTNPTEHGGYDLLLEVAGFQGPDPVEETTLKVRYMGAQSGRQDWYIASQRPNSAHPLWRAGRAFDPDSFSPGGLDFVVLIRDDSDRFHARWISSESFAQLPPELQERFQEKEIGVWARGGA